MGDQGSIYSLLQDVPIMVSPHYRLPKQIFIASELTPVPESIDSLTAYSFTVEKETLSMMEDARKQQDQERERLAQLQQTYREERIKQQKLAARKIAPGFLDTDTRILKPEPLHQQGDDTESMRRQQQVDYLRFEQALAPPDPWDQPPENDMMALRSILGASSQPAVAASANTVSMATTSQGPTHVPSEQGYPPVMWAVTPDTSNNTTTNASFRPARPHHASSPPVAPALPPKPFFDASTTSSTHTSPQAVASILPNATAIATSSPSDPSNSPVIPPPLPPPPTHPAREDLIQELVNMGFSRPQAADALEKNDHDLTKATNFLLDHGTD